MHNVLKQTFQKISKNLEIDRGASGMCELYS